MVPPRNAKERKQTPRVFSRTLMLLECSEQYYDLLGADSGGYKASLPVTPCREWIPSKIFLFAILFTGSAA